MMGVVGSDVQLKATSEEEWYRRRIVSKVDVRGGCPRMMSKDDVQGGCDQRRV
jgi:hypothetical protein